MTHWVDPIPALKRRVADEILILIAGWSQTYAAYYLGAPRSRVSDLRRGHLERMTLDRMLRMLSRLHRDIEIRTRRAPGPGGSTFPHAKLDGIASTDSERR
jgi:predicted XRE-type DNA-binding protein